MVRSFSGLRRHCVPTPWLTVVVPTEGLLNVNGCIVPVTEASSLGTTLSALTELCSRERGRERERERERVQQHVYREKETDHFLEQWKKKTRPVED